MSEKKDGGPAYPRPIKAVGMGSFSDGAFDEYGIECDEGMSLRDWFAGMALQGELSAAVLPIDTVTEKQIAHICYKIADAMLKEREK